MDPLDPLTEIINSGQAYSQAIAIERVLWLIIGVFFIGALSSSIKITIRNQNPSGKKTNYQFFKPIKNKDEVSKNSSSDQK